VKKRFFLPAAGFTLLEVLLAIVLLALLLAGAYGSIHAARRAMSSGEQVIERTNRLRVAQEFIRHQLTRTLPLSFGQDKSTGNNYVFEGKRDSLRFIAPMPGYLSNGGAYVQTLDLERVQGGMQLIFAHQMLNGFDLDNPRKDEDNEPVVLIDQIREGKFEFRHLEADGKLSDWKDKWEDTAQLPLMVRLDLTMTDDSRLIWPTMDIPLLLGSGASPRVFMPNPGDGVDFGPAPGMPPVPGGTPR